MMISRQTDRGQLDLCVNQNEDIEPAPRRHHAPLGGFFGTQITCNFNLNCSRPNGVSALMPLLHDHSLFGGTLLCLAI